MSEPTFREDSDLSTGSFIRVMSGAITRGRIYPSAKGRAFYEGDRPPTLAGAVLERADFEDLKAAIRAMYRDPVDGAGGAQDFAGERGSISVREAFPPLTGGTRPTPNTLGWGWVVLLIVGGLCWALVILGTL